MEQQRLLFHAHYCRHCESIANAHTLEATVDPVSVFTTKQRSVCNRTMQRSRRQEGIGLYATECPYERYGHARAILGVLTDTGVAIAQSQCVDTQVRTCRPIPLFSRASIARDLCKDCMNYLPSCV